MGLLAPSYYAINAAGILKQDVFLPGKNCFLNPKKGWERKNSPLAF